MNKQSIRSIRQQAQQGFTLIELIVVIVILGILAATALPRFASLGGNARAAALQAAQGALSSTVAMIHGQYLISPTAGTYTVEGNIAVTANAASFGYPAGAANTVAAAGITATDYTVTYNATSSLVAATATVPAIPANGFVVVPNSINGTATALTCFLSYAQSTALGTPPVLTLTTGNCGT